MDALRLNLKAKDQLHPMLTDLMSVYSRFKGSNEWQGRPKLVGWSVFLKIFFSNINNVELIG